MAAGSVLAARLVATRPQAIARAEGVDFLLPKGAPGMAEGASLTIEVTREALGGNEPWKRPLARVTDAIPSPAAPDGRPLVFPAPTDELVNAGWLDLLDEARSGIIQFPGGELRVSLTPAMTLIDVDGTLPPEALALVAGTAAALAIRRHGIGGSIGIDFPTVAGKGARQRIAEAIDVILPSPFERTAVNGFGFLQVVRPRRHPSLFELAADRAPSEARALLRQAAREQGSILLVAHPAVIAAIEQGDRWTDRLAAQVGGAVDLRADPRLAMEAGHVAKA